MVVRALGQCHAECPWCARDFWKWVKGRMKAMDRGEFNFNSAAATSIRAAYYIKDK